MRLTKQIGGKGLRTRGWMPYVLSAMLTLPLNLPAQQPASSPETKRIVLVTAKTLKVMPLAGQGEMNDLERRIMAPLVVQVLDQNDRPIEGADVVLRFPLKGPSAIFANQKSAQTVKTNPDGQAAATGWAANNEVGIFQVHITASHGNDQGEAVISMRNVQRVVEDDKRKSKSWWSSRWTKVAIVAGAAAGVAGIVLATQGGGSSTPTITASPGSPTIGGPR